MVLGKLIVSPWSSDLGCCGIKQAFGVSLGLPSTLQHMDDIRLVGHRCIDAHRRLTSTVLYIASQSVTFILNHRMLMTVTAVHL